MVMLPMSGRHIDRSPGNAIIGGMSVAQPDRRSFFRIVECAACAALWQSAGSAHALAASRHAERVPSHTRPMFIEKACLRVRNLAGMLLFYRQVIGLEVMSETNDGAVLGVGSVGLIELIGDPDAVQPARNAAGLYHVAFEMPTRKDLARWAVHAVKSNFQLSGAADHLVTESFYLNDPEGNGVEVYASRPEKQWKWDAGRVAMGVFDPDIEGLLKLAINDRDEYTVAPSAMRIGHIHLKVGGVKAAENFYSKVIGLDVTRQAPGVVFMSSGKYHHHVATNVWESDGATTRDERAAGLCWFSIAVADPPALKKLETRLRNAGAPLKVMPEWLETADPWGHKIRLISARSS